MDRHYDLRHLKVLSGPNNKYKDNVITCVTSRHGDSSNHEESSDNNKGAHNVGSGSQGETGPTWLVRVICGQDVNDLSHW